MCWNFCFYISYHGPKQTRFLSINPFASRLEVCNFTKQSSTGKMSFNYLGEIGKSTDFRIMKIYQNLNKYNLLGDICSFLIFFCYQICIRWCLMIALKSGYPIQDRERKSPERNQLIFCHGTSKVNGWTFLQK